jgi:hypothetical protein
MVATASGTASPNYTKYNGFPGISFNGTSNTMTTPSTYSFGTTGSTWIAVSVNFSAISATLPVDAPAVVVSSGAPERAIRYDPTTSATLYSIHTGTLRQETGNNTNGIRGFIDTTAAFNTYTNGRNTYSTSTSAELSSLAANQSLVMGHWNAAGSMVLFLRFSFIEQGFDYHGIPASGSLLGAEVGYTSFLPVGHPGTLAIIVPTLQDYSPPHALLTQTTNSRRFQDVSCGWMPPILPRQGL